MAKSILLCFKLAVQLLDATACHFGLCSCCSFACKKLLTFRFGLFAFRNITVVAYHGSHQRVIQQISHGPFHPAPGVVFVMVAKFNGSGVARLAKDASELPRCVVQILGMNELKAISSYRLFDGIACDPLD